MKRLLTLMLSIVAGVSISFAQEPPTLHGYTTVRPVTNGPSNGSIQPILSGVSPIPSWNYSIVGYDGHTYTGTVLGRSPSSRIKTTTTIPLQIVPLIITIDNGGGDVFKYDPSVTDPCISPGSHTDVDAVTGSPLFQNNNWTMNGVNVGNTQYEDAFQRAEFWSLVGGSAYHVLLSPSVVSTQTLTFGSNGTSGAGTNYNFGGCTPLGIVNIDQLDNAIQGLITGPLAATVNVGTFPIFVMRNVVSSTSGVSLSACCVLGYHGAFTSGSNLQVYSPFTFDSDQAFGSGYTNGLSHELGEALNDPTGINPTPQWGAEGQVAAGSCQNNLEVGDPLSPGFGTPTNSFTTAGANGLSYTVQEMAFFNWFFGGANTGAGGLYSDNGTFAGHAKACPPGGTN